MTAIFTGANFGFGRSSVASLGGLGVIGTASTGRGGEEVYVNAATGNLVLQKRDEFVSGRGPDASVARTYNSLTTQADDNNDRWRLNTDRNVRLVFGTLNTPGSSVARIDGDGTRSKYVWDSARSAYVSTDGGGAYLTLSNASSEWLWTDSDTGMVERYSYDALGTIKSATDIDGNAVQFAYDGSGRLSTITTSDGSSIRYTWSGTTQNLSEMVTAFIDLSSGVLKTLTRTHYGYDGSNRLQTVTVDLSPEDAATSDGNVYVTTYEYRGATNFVSKMTQSDGSQLDIAYDGSDRVQTLTELVAAGVSRTTQFAYYADHTDITDAANQVTRVDYDGLGQLTKITAPPAYAGAAQQIVEYGYNANGDVVSVKDANLKTTTYGNFTANGLAQTITDSLNNVVSRTYDAQNHLMSESHSGSMRTVARSSRSRATSTTTSGICASRSLPGARSPSLNG